LQQAFHLGAASRSGVEALQRGHVGKELSGGELWICPEVLWEVSENALHKPPLVPIADVPAVDASRAARRSHEGGQNAHQGRLSRSVGSEQAEHAFRDLQVDAVERANSL